MMLERRRGMAGALEGDVSNSNAEIATVDEIVINEGEQNGNVIQVRRKEISPQIEVVDPVAAPGAVPLASMATPKPPLPASPVMGERSEVQETHASRSPAQENVQWSGF